MPNINSLSTSLGITIAWNAQGVSPGTGYPAATSNASPPLSKTVSTNATAGVPANNTAGGADSFVSKLYTIAASGNTSIDLTSLTDILGQSAVSLARLKGLVIRLLSATDDATNGTAASSITVGNSGANDFLGPLAGTTPTYSIKNGGIWLHADPSAAGFTVDGTHKILKVVNNDGVNAACVSVTLIGATS